MHTPKQLNLFEYARRAQAVRAKPAAAPLTLADYRRMLHSAQVMQLNPRYTAREHGLLSNLERYLRAQIRMERARSR
jgi:hypothetical protein